MKIKKSNNRKHYILSEKETDSLMNLITLKSEENGIKRIARNRFKFHGNTILDVIKNNDGYEYLLYNSKSTLSGYSKKLLIQETRHC